MPDSPLAQLFEAFDRLDTERVEAQFAPDASILIADGRRAQGMGAVHALLGDVLEGISSMSHRITAEWHQDDVWIAEVEADYEIRNWRQLKALPRAFVLRRSADGITELHVYGAHEHPLTEYPDEERGTWVGGQWMPPL